MSINQEPLWSAKLPNGEVRSGTLQQLSDAFRAGHVGEGTLVCASGSTQWMRLADLLGTPVPAPAGVAPASAPESPPVRAPVASAPAPAPAPMSGFPPPAPGGDVWQVRLATGQLRSGTRQQLEEAFRAGHLTDDLLVLPSGAPSWITLGSVLGRSAAPPAPVAPAPAAYSRPPAPVAAPVPAPAPAPAPAVVAPVVAPVAAPVAPPASAAPAPPAGDPQLQVRMPDGQVRAGTRQQLEEAVRAGHLAADTLVLAPGSSQWVPLAAFADPLASEASRSNGHADSSQSVQSAQPGAAEAPPEPPAETPVAPPPVEGEQARSEPETAPREESHWQVQLTDAQLEAAVQAGIVGEDAQVLAVGTDQWVRLSELRRAHQGEPA